MFAASSFRWSLAFALAMSLSAGWERAQAQGDPKKPDVKEDTRLVTIGSYAAAQVYTTYGYIGTVADSYASKHYDAKRTKELMGEVVLLQDNLATQLKKMKAASPLTDEDAKALDDIVGIHGLLKAEAQALMRFVNEGSSENADEFEKARKAAWPRIAKLLEIKETPDAPEPAPKSDPKSK